LQPPRCNAARPRSAVRCATVDTSRAPIIGFTPNTWAAGWSSRRRILQGLAERGWPTLYSSGPMTVWDIGMPGWREQPWLPAVAHCGHLRVDVPGRLLVSWPTKPFYERLALRAHARHLRRSCGAPAGNHVALLFHPRFWPQVHHLEPRFVVYYTYDAHRLAPGWTSELAHHEAQLVERADLIVAYSQGMLDCLPGSGPQRGFVLPTGVDMAPFERADAQACPADLERIPRPRLGYVGRVNQKLDYALVLDVARRRPRWHWVFVGAVGASADGRFATDRNAEALWMQCRALPNVHVFGSRPHADVPRYLMNMDVNVMCYRTQGHGWWSEIFPLKSMEYLAAGKPIVSTPVKSIQRFGDTLAIAATANEWIAAIEHAVAAGGIGTAQSRRDVARANTWDQRIDRLHGLIVESLQRPAWRKMPLPDATASALELN
jgi:glycosyltransferase involved in cell wall biosynthesis